MYRLSVLLVAILQFSIPLCAQDSLHPAWVLKRTSPVALGNAEGFGIGTYDAGNIYWATSATMPGFNQGMDIIVYKMDRDTNVLWQTVYGGQFAQQAYNLVKSDTLIIVGGRSCRTNDLFLRGCDALVLALDPATGDTLWSTIWTQGYGYEEVDGIALKDDGIYITGWTVSDTLPNDDVDLMLLKLDYSGGIIWQNTFGAPGNRNDHQDGHNVVDDSMLYVAGLYDGNPGTNPVFFTKDYDGLALLAKFDRATGNLVDYTTFGRSDTWVNAENALGMTSDGTYLYLTGYTTPEANNWDIFIAKYDKDLNELWYTTWGGPDIEAARSIAVVPDGHIFVGANTNSYGSGKLDVALLKLDPQGNVLWYKTWGGPEDDNVLDIYLADTVLYLTGRTATFHPNARNEAFLIKVDARELALQVPELKPGAGLVHAIYPNPTGGMITVDFASPGQRAFFRLFSLSGQEVFAGQIKSGEPFAPSAGTINQGLYLYLLQLDDGRMATGKLVLK